LSFFLFSDAAKMNFFRYKSEKSHYGMIFDKEKM